MTSTLPSLAELGTDSYHPVLDLSHPATAASICRRINFSANATNLRFRVNEILSEYNLKIEGRGANEFIGDFLNFLRTYGSIRFLKDVPNGPIDELSQHTVLRKALSAQHFKNMVKSPVFGRCEFGKVVFADFLLKYAEII